MRKETSRCFHKLHTHTGSTSKLHSSGEFLFFFVFLEKATKSSRKAKLIMRPGIKRQHSNEIYIFVFVLDRLGGGRYSSKQPSSSNEHERNTRQQDEIRSITSKNLPHSQSQNSMNWRTHGSGGILKTERWVGDDDKSRGGGGMNRIDKSIKNILIRVYTSEHLEERRQGFFLNEKFWSKNRIFFSFTADQTTSAPARLIPYSALATTSTTIITTAAAVIAVSFHRLRAAALHMTKAHKHPKTLSVRRDAINCDR